MIECCIICSWNYIWAPSVPFLTFNLWRGSTRVLLAWAGLQFPPLQHSMHQIKIKNKLQIFSVPFPFQREFQHSPHKLKLSQLSPDFCFRLVITSGCCLLLLKFAQQRLGWPSSWVWLVGNKCTTGVVSSGKCLFLCRSEFLTGRITVNSPRCSDFCSPCCHDSSRLTSPFAHSDVC